MKKTAPEIEAPKIDDKLSPIFTHVIALLLAGVLLGAALAEPKTHGPEVGGGGGASVVNVYIDTPTSFGNGGGSHGDKKLKDLIVKSGGSGGGGGLQGYPSVKSTPTTQHISIPLHREEGKSFTFTFTATGSGFGGDTGAGGQP